MGVLMEDSKYGDCLMDTRLLTKLTVDSKIGVSSVSSKSESVSIIPWICLALAKYLRSGTKRHLLRKWALERFACLQRGQERLCCLGGGVEQVNHDCGGAEQRCETILRSCCYGFPLEEREGPEIF